jgi:hypothetical protein
VMMVWGISQLPPLSKLMYGSTYGTANRYAALASSAMAIVAIGAVAGCSESGHAAERAAISRGVVLAPRSDSRVLVEDATPSGITFSVVAESYRFQGRAMLDLRVTFKGYRGGGTFSPVDNPHKALSYSTLKGCLGRRPYEIVFGLLRPREATVIVETSGPRRPLRKVRLSRELRTNDTLVYVALSDTPRAILVRTASGGEIERETLRLPATSPCSAKRHQTSLTGPVE